MSEASGAKPSWYGLFAVQFLGFFSRGFLLGMVGMVAVLGKGLESATLALLIYLLPYPLLSPLFGRLSRVVHRDSVVHIGSALDILCVGVAIVAFAAQLLPLAFAAAFLLGIQSALIGPSRAVLVRDFAGRHGLVFGNGILAMLASTSVVLGLLAAGLVSHSEHRVGWAVAIWLAATISGWALSLLVRVREREATPNQAPPSLGNPVTYLQQSWQSASGSRGLNLAILGNASFWMIGTLVLLSLWLHGTRVLHLSDTGILEGLAGAGTAFGLGCFAAALFSKDRIELAFLPLGGIGLATGLSAAALLPFPSGIFLLLVAAAAFASGFFKIPTVAWIQGRTRRRERGLGSAMTYMGLANSAAVLLGLGIAWAFSRLIPSSFLGIPSSRALLAFAAAWAWLVTLVVVAKFPNVSSRTVARLLMRLLFRLQVRGAEVVPEFDGALLVCNHVTLMDALLVQAASPRGVRFVMLHDVWSRPLANWFFRMMGVIPVAPGSLRSVAEFVKNCREALKSGQVICIFAEGQPSRTGYIQEFQRGIEVVLRDLDVPVIPMCMDGVFGAPFSMPGGRLQLPTLVSWRKHVEMRFGEPMCSPVAAWQVRQAVQELSIQAFADRLPSNMTLASGFLEVARSRSSKKLLGDSTGVSLTRRQALLRAAAIAEYWNERFEPGERVGLLFPSTAAGALMNISLTLSGRIPVNLNYTASKEAYENACAKAGIHTIITSKVFLEKLGREAEPGMLFAEDLTGLLQTRHKLKGAFYGLLAPIPLACRHFARRKVCRDDVATILFSSGSTGLPKGIPLTHGNILGSVEGLRRIYRFLDDDVMVGALPFFHAYGFTGTIWFPIFDHISAVYHPNPTEAKAVGDLIEAAKGTIIISTPTFLENYLRRNPREKLGTLRHIISGAEKLSDQLRKLWHDMQGGSIREGYGATECSPIIAVNSPDWEGTDLVGQTVVQRGTLEHAVGMPVPGVAVRVVDRDDFSRVLPPGEEGMLLVKGAIVMKGYLDDPEATQKAFHDGWYVTGDIVRVTPQGFIQITDRVSRFSKIGGEMVPHMRVEEELQLLSGFVERVFAVVGLPHPAKGEQLAVVTTLSQQKLSELFDHLSHDSTLPPLWRPKPSMFVHAEELPLMPTGKTDLLTVRKIAREALLSQDAR